MTWMSLHWLLSLAALGAWAVSIRISRGVARDMRADIAEAGRAVNRLRAELLGRDSRKEESLRSWE